MEIALELDYDTPTRTSLSEQKISAEQNRARPLWWIAPLCTIRLR